jgi:putative inorganic carbon (HCO3(-)) transporter
MRAFLGYLERWNWLFLAAAAPLILFPGNGRILALLSILLVWGICWAAGKAPVMRTPLSGALLGLGVMMLVSLYVTYDLQLSYAKVAGLVLGMAVFFLVVQKGLEKRGWWIALGVFQAGGLMIAVLGLVGTNWMLKWRGLEALIGRMPRLISGLPGAVEGFHPNEVAGALLWTLPGLLVFGMSWLKKRPVNKVGWLVGLFILAVAGLEMVVFILTQSRSAYLGIGLSGVFMLWLVLPRRGRWLFTSLVALAAVGLAFWMLSPGGQESLDWLVNDRLNAAPMASLDTLNGRVELWKQAIRAIADFPLTGMGMNTFRTVAPVLYPLFLTGVDFDFGHAHNEILQVGLDLGLPGMLAYIWMVGLCLILWWQALHSARQARGFMNSGLPDQYVILLGLGWGYLAHLVYGLADAITLGAKPGILLWLLQGLIVAAWMRSRT